MLLRCEVIVVNRCVSTTELRKCYATFCLLKKNDKCGEDVVSFVVHTSKNKSGDKYQIKGNILQAHSKFIEEGKCTLSMKDPPHDLIISKANPSSLKKFLHVLKLAYKGEDTSSEDKLNTIVHPNSCDLEKPKTYMRILTKENYPIRKSFPPSLESLIVLHCSLRKFDRRILKLFNLKVLDLSYNNLTNLCPNMDSLIHLWSVKLSNNAFQTVPSCLIGAEVSKRITLLDLSDNQIKYLPNRLRYMKELITLMLSRNEIEYLPANFGRLQKLKDLHLEHNKINVLPWSFRVLQLNQLNLMGNLFDKKKCELKNSILDSVPSLFELSARCIATNKTKIPEDYLPHFVLERIENVKFCPCGTPCFVYFIPYVQPFNLLEVSSVVSYDHFSAGRTMAKIVGYFCSKVCYEKWLANPNTLFTSKKRKR